MTTPDRSGANREGHVSYTLSKIWEQGRMLPHITKAGYVRSVIVRALRDMILSPLTTLLTLLTISISLAVFGGFLLVIENLGEVLTATQTELSLTVYLKDSAAPEKVQALMAEVRTSPELSEVSFTDKDTALRQFRESLGSQSGILDGLESENPLPASLKIKFKPAVDSAEVFKKFSDRFSKNELVEKVHYSEGALSQLGAVVRLFRNAGGIAIFLMFITTAFIIANTIRLALYSHRDEIEIMQLVGAGEAYVRTPYLIEGGIQGVLGSLLSICMLYMIYSVARGMVQDSELLNMMFPNLHFISFSSLLIILICGVSVGVGGSYGALRRFTPN